MADFGDDAQALSEQILAKTLANRKTLSIPFSGRCLACDEPVEEARFCDGDCREDFEQRQALKRRNGAYTQN